MECTARITPDLLWVGGNDRRLNLFENIFPIPRGVSYNSYLLLDEKTVLVDTVDKAIEVCGLPKRKCVTKKFRIHGYRKNPALTDHMYVYGSDEPKICLLYTSPSPRDA
mgnify:CR=1 FL=1